jgi:hypothetical protein
VVAPNKNPSNRAMILTTGMEYFYSEQEFRQNSILIACANQKTTLQFALGQVSRSGSCR